MERRIEEWPQGTETAALEMTAEEAAAAEMMAETEEVLSFTAVIDGVERKLIEQALRKAGGNRTRAGNMLCLTRQTLNYKIKRLNIEVSG